MDFEKDIFRASYFPDKNHLSLSFEDNPSSGTRLEFYIFNAHSFRYDRDEDGHGISFYSGKILSQNNIPIESLCDWERNGLLKFDPEILSSLDREAVGFWITSADPNNEPFNGLQIGYAHLLLQLDQPLYEILEISNGKLKKIISRFVKELAPHILTITVKTRPEWVEVKTK